MQVLYSQWSNWSLEKLVFVEGGKPWNSEKTLGARLGPTTNSIHIWHQNRTQATVAGGGWGAFLSAGRVEKKIALSIPPINFTEPAPILKNLLRGSFKIYATPYQFFVAQFRDIFKNKRLKHTDETECKGLG